MRSLEAKISRAQPFKRRTIGADHVRAEGFRRRDEPRIVLAKPSRGTALKQCASLRLSEVQSLNGETLQRRERSRRVGGSFEDLLYAHD
jgi:hypothetical protein